MYLFLNLKEDWFTYYDMEITWKFHGHFYAEISSNEKGFSMWEPRGTTSSYEFHHGTHDIIVP